MADAVKHFLRLLSVAALLLTIAIPPAAADERAEREGLVKAAYLFHFAEYVTWPDDAFGRGDAPIVIGVLGHDAFNGALERAVRDKRVGEHPLTVAHFENASKLRPCHILFVCPSEADSLEDVVRRAGANTLTVGDVEGFTDRGGIIRFYPDDTKVRFEVNLEALRHSRLRISSKLLKVAKVVHE